MPQRALFVSSRCRLLRIAIPLLTPSLAEFLTSNLDINVGPGPDGLLSLFFVNWKQHISLPLCTFFIKSLGECYFVHLWRFFANCELSSHFACPVLLQIPRYVCDWKTHGFAKHWSTSSNVLIYQSPLLPKFSLLNLLPQSSLGFTPTSSIVPAEFLFTNTSLLSFLLCSLFGSLLSVFYRPPSLHIDLSVFAVLWRP